MPFFQTKKPAWVGLSLHPEQIGLMKFVDDKHALMIESFKSAPLPLDFICDGKIQQPEALTQMVQAMVQEADAENCKAIISFPLNQVIQKRIKLAAFLRDEECMAEIATNLVEYFPSVHEALNFDYVKRVTSSIETDCLLVAARTEQVNGYIEPIETAGLVARVLDLDVYALSRALNYLYGVADWLTVLLDTSAAQLLVTRMGEIVFSHPIKMDTVDNMTQSLRWVLQFILTTIPVSELQRVYLSGNLLWQHEIAAIFLEVFSAQVKVVNPFASFPLGDSVRNTLENSASAVTALGLALRGLPKW